MQHSVLSASGCHRWMECPGSVELSKQAPEPATSGYAAEGTAAHALAERCLSKGCYGADPHQFLGEMIERYRVTEEMADAVKVYTDEVKKVFEYQSIINPDTELLIEKRFNLDWLYKGMFGTNDACIKNREGIFIFDYKHGVGVPVEVEENRQLLYYALGGLTGSKLERGVFKDVTLCIVQPRCDHADGSVRTWTTDIQYLTDFANKLRECAIATTKPNAPLKCGKWCRWCKASAICPEQRKTVSEIAKIDFSDSGSSTECVQQPCIPKPDTLSEGQLKRILDYSPMITTWLKDCAGHAMGLLQAGKTVEGYKLVKRKSNRKWRDDSTVESKLKEFEVDVFDQPKLKGPATIEKELKKLLTKDELNSVMSDLVIKPDAGLTLAPSSDRRKAVNQASHDFRRDFLD